MTMAWCVARACHWVGMRRASEPLSLCTVRPNVIALDRELEGLGVEIESAQLGPDVFNELMLREPSGMACGARGAQLHATGRGAGTHAAGTI